MGIYQLNENLSVRLKALQLYIYWDALIGLKYHLVHLCTVMNQTSGGLILFKNHGKIKYINFSANLEIKVHFCLPQVSQTRKLWYDRCLL